jgi:hypothetical protein
MRARALVLVSVLAAGCVAGRVSDFEVTCTQRALEAGEVFHEDWDGCVEGWRTRDGEPVATVADTLEPGRKLVQHLTRARTWSASAPATSHSIQDCPTGRSGQWFAWWRGPRAMRSNRL